MVQSKNIAVLIAGPTASGKSKLALQMAGELEGVIINTDSMQVYSVLNILTARPQEEDLERAKHFLYGFLSPEFRCSTGVWLREVAKLLERDDLKNKNKIFVGGTGLYFEALTQGFIEIPPVSEQIVDEIERLVAPLSRQQRMDLLQERDPEMAKVLLEPDRQRLVRALSVLAGTGRSLANWQKDEQKGLLASHGLKKIVLNPNREILNDRIKSRFLTMLEGGAIDEVKNIMSLDIDPSMPAMKAIGVREISSLLAGKISREEAIEKAVIASRQYAKRQRTWFRRRMENWEWRS